MEFKHLKTFMVVSEIQGFTKAAEVLGYVQSSVTSQIQALEEEIGVPLFDRLGRKVALTDVGRRLVPYAQEMLRLQEAVRDLTQSTESPAGTLRIGAPESLAAYRLPSIIRTYKARNGDLDVAFVLQPETQTTDLLSETLVEEKMALIAPIDHPLVGKSRVDPRDLDGETLLHTEPSCSYRGLFDTYLQGYGVVPAATMEFWNIEAIKNCVMSGLGISILPQVTVQSELEDGKLAALRWDEEAVQVSTQLVWHKAKWISPALREFLYIVRDEAAGWS